MEYSSLDGPGPVGGVGQPQVEREEVVSSV